MTGAQIPFPKFFLVHYFFTAARLHDGFDPTAPTDCQATNMPAVSNSTPLMSLSAVVLDTETTGLDANSARIIQIGAVRLVLGNLRIEESFDELVNPELPIPPESMVVHGIHDDDIRDASTFADVSKDLEAFTLNAVIIGHSVGYDLAILKHEYGRLKIKWERPRSLDTMVLAQIANPMLADYSIEAVSSWLGVEVEGRHTALGDALTTARIFLTLVPLLRSKGIRTLAEAERSSRSLGDILHRHETAGWLEPAIDPAIPAVDTANKVARIDSFPFRH
ncbi:MAG: 3'-5' exonuclease, partial [Geminicoccaceae bacterium]